MDLVNRLLDHPARVAVDPVSSPVELIQQSAWPWTGRTRPSSWSGCWAAEIPSALVFTRTKHGADKVSQDLNRAGVPLRRHPRQQVPDRPADRSGQLQGGENPGAGGHRHRRPGPGHPGPALRHQLQPARGPRDLYPPHLLHFRPVTGWPSPSTTSARPPPAGGGEADGEAGGVLQGAPWPMENFEAPVRDKHGKSSMPRTPRPVRRPGERQRPGGAAEEGREGGKGGKSRKR